MFSIRKLRGFAFTKLIFVGKVIDNNSTIKMLRCTNSKDFDQELKFNKVLAKEH